MTVPFDYTLSEVAREMGVPPWELTKPLPPDEDAERLMWLERELAFRRMRAQGRVRHG